MGTVIPFRPTPAPTIPRPPTMQRYRITLTTGERRVIHAPNQFEAPLIAYDTIDDLKIPGVKISTITKLPMFRKA